MDYEQDRNPSPPPEILDNEDLLPDKIGDSIYSKRWFYQALMDIVKSCEPPPQEEQNSESACQSHTMDDSENDMIELDPKIEEDACTLWDMSASQSVAEFMNETGVPGIILDVIEKTKSPRLLEIVVGILGNMSSFDSVCTSISENPLLLSTILYISGTSDTPTLLQVFRVVKCGVRNKSSEALWIAALAKNPIFFENLKFIFENSLNGTIIIGAYEVLHSLLSASGSFQMAWGEPPYLDSIIEAAKQLLKSKNKLDTFFCLLNAVCEYEPNVKKVAEYWTDLNVLFTTYFLSLDEDEPLPDESQVISIYSCFDTFTDIVKTESVNRELIFPDVKVLKVMTRLACSVNAMILNVRKDNLNIADLQNPDGNNGAKYIQRKEIRDGRTYVHMMNDYEFNNWECLGDVIVKTAKTLLPYADKKEEQELLNEAINSEVHKENINVLIM